MGILQFKSEYEAIRARPALYIGLVGSSGLSNLLGDLILDAATIFRSKEIRLRLRKSGEIEFSFKKSEIDSELVRTTLKGQYGKQREHLLSLIACAALSTTFEFQLNGKTHKVDRNGNIRPSVRTKANSVAGEMIVTFSPDASIFGNTGPEGLLLYQRMSEVAITIPDMKIIIRSDYTKPFTQIVAHCPNGIQQLLDLEASKCFGRDFEQCFNFNERGIHGQIGWFYARNYGQPSQGVSFANGRITDFGGSHVWGLLEGIRQAVRNKINGNKDEYDLSLGYIANNLCLAVSVWGNDFSYKGNTKSCLEHKLTRKVIKQLVAKKLEGWMEGYPEKEKEFIDRFRKQWPFDFLKERIDSDKVKK